MNKNLNRLIVLFVIIATLLMSFPKTVFADGGEGGTEQEVNGYHVKLIFVEPVKAGENQFHIQITDSMGMPVTNAEVEVCFMSPSLAEAAGARATRPVRARPEAAVRARIFRMRGSFGGGRGDRVVVERVITLADVRQDANPVRVKAG